jgi:hypothetical protein
MLFSQPGPLHLFHGVTFRRCALRLFSNWDVYSAHFAAA